MYFAKKAGKQGKVGAKAKRWAIVGGTSAGGGVGARVGTERCQLKQEKG